MKQMLSDERMFAQGQGSAQKKHMHVNTEWALKYSGLCAIPISPSLFSFALE